MKGRFSALVSIDMCHENNVFIDFLDIQIKKKIKIYIYIITAYADTTKN